MNAAVDAYIKESFQKLRQLRTSEKGEVWLASDKSGKLVVIKEISLTGLPYKNLKENPQSVAPKVIYCSEHDGTTLVVEEYLQGESLLALLEQGRYLTEKEAAKILLDLCDGLRPLHEQGIIHRDIKPSNLILQNGGIIRLIDFDAARIVKDDKNEDTRLLGTKGYAPPEQFGYGQTDERSDIYSIGITVKKMLGKKYCGYLTNILDKCTEIDPKKRYASVISLKRDILWQRRKLLRRVSLVLCCMIAFSAFFFLTKVSEAPKTTLDDIAATKSTVSLTNPAIEPQNERTQQSSVENAAIEKEIHNHSVQKEDNSESKFSPLPLLEFQSPTQPKIQQPLPHIEQPIEQPMETKFSLNGNTISSTQTDIVYLDRKDWGNYQANLHVENNSHTTWNNPQIKIVFSDNWGGKYTETKVLPSVAPGAAADFFIPVGSYSVTRSEMYPDTSAWLQVYLDNGNLKATENYWCIEFNLRENGKLSPISR